MRKIQDNTQARQEGRAIFDHHPDNEFAQDNTMGGRISMAREAMQLSIAQAARRLGVKTSSWRAWETDSAAPRANRVAMMAGILGVSPSWLLMGRGPGPSEDNPIRLDNQQLDTLLRDLRVAMADVVSAQQRVQDLVGQLEALNRLPSNGHPELGESELSEAI